MSKQKDKSESQKTVESSLLGTIIPRAAALPVELVLSKRTATPGGLDNLFKATDYVYNIQDAIAANPAVKDIPIAGKIKNPFDPKKTIDVKPSQSVFQWANPFRKASILTPVKNDKISAAGLHEIGHAINIEGNKEYKKKFINAGNNAFAVQALANLLSATSLSEDNPLLVGGTGGLIAGILTHKNNKLRARDEARASAWALNHIRKVRPDRRGIDAKLLKKALSTYKVSLPFKTLFAAVTPLSIAYARQYLNKGEIKQDAVLDKLFK